MPIFAVLTRTSDHANRGLLPTFARVQYVTSDGETNFGRYLTVKEAAAFLGVAESTVRNWDRSGKVRASRHPVNHYRLYHPTDLKRLLKEFGGRAPDSASAPEKTDKKPKDRKPPLARPVTTNDAVYTVTLDDDAIVPRLIQRILGIRTLHFATVADLKTACDDLSPVGAFVDIHLADGNSGLEIVPRIKACWPTCPIIVITGDSSEALVGQALAMGADDFIAKPIRPLELTARYLARKSEIELRTNQTVLHFGDLTLNLLNKSLAGPLGACFPSPREVEILGYLIRSNGLLIDKNTLKSRIWGSISVSDNALDRKLFEVRRAIRTVSSVVEIHSVYGHGIELRQRSLNSASAFYDDETATDSSPGEQ